MYQEELDFAKNLAREAGDIMLRYFRAHDIGTKEKDDKTLVTLADTEINSLVIERVKQTFPKHSVHGEEEKMHVKDAEYTWVCDPVDGTQPFAKGLPISTFSLALVDARGASVVGVVYDPYQDRLYEAVKGGGARMNGDIIYVSKLSTLHGAAIDQELWVNEKEGVSFDDPRDILNRQGAVVTVLCSAVIAGCLVAEGRYDAMIFGQSKPEDIAALAVIVGEAGGTITDLDGNDQRYDHKIKGAIVSNGLLHSKIVGVVSNINYQSKYLVR